MNNKKRKRRWVQQAWRGGDDWVSLVRFGESSLGLVKMDYKRIFE